MKFQSVPARTNVFYENIVIFLRFIFDLILLVIFLVAITASDFLAIPLAISWISLLIAAIYLFARGRTPASIWAAVGIFSAQMALGLVSSLGLTRGAWQGRLCGEFSSLSNPCSTALAVVGVSWLTTTIAFAGILLSLAGPLNRLYLSLRVRRKPKANKNPNEHEIELSSMPSQPSDDRFKEGWTDIPV